jgi:hypothetical protein
MEASTNGPPVDEPVPGWKLWTVFVPFLIAVVLVMIHEIAALRHALGTQALVLDIGLLVMLLIPVISGFMMGLPRWAIPSVGVLVGIASILIFSSWINFLPPFPHYSSVLGKVLLVVIARFMFFGHMLLLGALLVLAAAWLPPLQPFYTSLRRDWSLLSFLLYGSVLPILFVVFDEYRGSAPYQTAGLLILAVGAWVYLRRSQPSTCLYALLVAVALTMGLLGLGKYLLYPHQLWSAYTTFPRWWEALVPLIEGAVLLVIIAVPALLKLFPTNSTQAEGAVV